MTEAHILKTSYGTTTKPNQHQQGACQEYRLKSSLHTRLGCLVTSVLASYTPPQDPLRDMGVGLLQIHKALVDWMGKLQ